jgi:signal transduction histidine kinase
VADHDRIAGDLHDHVIQQLFAVGMTLHSTAAALSERNQADRLTAQVDVLDETIARIRETIYRLNAPRTPREPLRNRLVEVVVAAVDALGFDPALRLTGPIDQVEPGLADDTVAVAREALSNCARHAAATAVAVSVSAADEWLVIEVVDNGRGIGSPTRSSGLANLRRRAEARGGALRLEPAATAHGTSLVWSARLAVVDEPGP